MLISAGAYLRFLQYEATRSISTPSGWDTSPSQVISQHFVRLSQKQFAGSHFRVHALIQAKNPRTFQGLSRTLLENFKDESYERALGTKTSVFTRFVSISRMLSFVDLNI